MGQVNRGSHNKGQHPSKHPELSPCEIGRHVGPFGPSKERLSKEATRWEASIFCVPEIGESAQTFGNNGSFVYVV